MDQFNSAYIILPDYTTFTVHDKITTAKATYDNQKLRRQILSILIESMRNIRHMYNTTKRCYDQVDSVMHYMFNLQHHYATAHETLFFVANFGIPTKALYPIGKSVHDIVDSLAFCIDRLSQLDKTFDLKRHQLFNRLQHTVLHEMITEYD